MGGGYHDADATRSYVTRTTASGRTMAHAAAVERREVEARVHPNLDPKRANKAGVVIRESFDNTDHPNSVPIAIFFDTTGSMSGKPLEFIKVLPELMETLNGKNLVTDPQLLFGAVNDATTMCIAPLEVGQFESGNQMDDVLSNILVSQGGGGGTLEESYDLAFYFMARKATLDCLTKRNKKGYLFMIGDEAVRPFVDKDEVKEYIGDNLQEDIPIETILTELREKFNVYWLFPAGTANYTNPTVQRRLTEMFGQNLIRLQNSGELCARIAATVAVGEGKDPRQVKKDLSDGLKAVASADEITAIVDSIPPRRIDDDL